MPQKVDGCKLSKPQLAAAVLQKFTPQARPRDVFISLLWAALLSVLRTFWWIMLACNFSWIPQDEPRRAQRGSRKSWRPRLWWNFTLWRGSSACRRGLAVSTWRKLNWLTLSEADRAGQPPFVERLVGCCFVCGCYARCVCVCVWKLACAPLCYLWPTTCGWAGLCQSWAACLRALVACCHWCERACR